MNSPKRSLMPANTLYLWYTGNPDCPVLVGELNLVMSGRGVSLRYGADWLHNGFPKHWPDFGIK